MYLKKLDLFGFKSFADRSELAFQPGMTAVVGPNGCGKSNVVDAFKWTFGEQSAKGLRGSEMKDVIFNGTQQRKPCGFCEVTIVFDNADRFLDLDYAEVAVTRRLFRSGESEYLINKQRCRLKDIKGLFLGTGIGQTSYSIFEQGKIDVLLQASSLDRRIIFEETAGISRYRSKKEETLRALARVQDNLTRLNDIVDEVEKRIQRLKAQAGKARRYRAASERLKELRLRSALDDHRHSVLASADTSFRLYWYNFNLTRGEKILDGLAAAAEERARRRRELVERLRGLREGVEAERLSIERTRERIENAGRRLEEIREERGRKVGELETTTAGLETLERQVAGEERELESLLLGLQATRAEFERHGREREESRRAHAEVEDGLRREKEEAVSLIEKRSRVGNALAHLDAELRNLEARRERLLAGIAAFQSQMAAERAREAGGRAEQERLTGEGKRLEEARQRLGAAVRELEAKIAVLEAEASRARAQLQQRVSRAEVLQGLEERLEGVSRGVASILRRAPGSARDTAECGGEAEARNSPFAQIHGMVASLLEVEGRFARAVESALGGRAQAVVVETQEGGLGLIDVAREEKLGAVEVICLDRVNPLAGEQFPRGGGVVGPLREKVQAKPGFEDLFDRLLANIVLVEDLETAMALSRNGLRPFRLVTLAGETVEPWGGLSLPGEAELGILSRRSELEDLRSETARREQECAAFAGQIDQGRAELALEREKVERCREEAAALERAAVEIEGVLAQAARELERLGREVAVGSAEAAELKEEVDSRTAERQQLVAEAAAVAEAERACEERTRVLGARAGESAERLQAAEAELARVQLELVEKEKRSETLREVLKRQTGVLAERRGTLEDLRRGIEALDAKEREAGESLRASRAELEEVRRREANLAAAHAAEEAAERELEEEEGALHSEADRVRQEYARIREEREAASLKIQEERQRRNHLMERLDEEYGIDLAKLIERELELELARELELEAAGKLVPAASAAAGGEPSPENRPAAGETPPPAAAAAGTDGAAEAAPAAEVEEDAAPGSASPVDAGGPSGDGPSGEERFLLPDPSWDREKARDEMRELQEKLRRMGSVNLEALDELDELEARYQFQLEQRRDLEESEKNLRGIIAEINRTSRERFLQTFEEVQKHFSDLFRKCFGGGKAELVLEEGADILDAGIDIVARPPGKKLSSLSLMSGGEKTMTTLALLFAIFRTRPSPFCILDEVDAPLDEPNVRRFVVLLKEFLAQTQFIVITHNKLTMAEANTLYGITMQEQGVSTKVAVELETYDPEKLSGAQLVT